MKLGLPLSHSRLPLSLLFDMTNLFFYCWSLVVSVTNLTLRRPTAQRDVFSDPRQTPMPEAEPEPHHHCESADSSSPISESVLSLSLGGDPPLVPEAALAQRGTSFILPHESRRKFISPCDVRSNSLIISIEELDRCQRCSSELVPTTPLSKVAKMGANCRLFFAGRIIVGSNFSANPPEGDIWDPYPSAASSSQCHYELLVLAALTFVCFYTLPFVKAAIAVSVFALLCLSLPQRVVALRDQIGEKKLKSLPLAAVLIVVFSAGLLVGLLV